MAEVTIVVCDVCGATDRHTRRYGITRGEDSSHFDLCPQHAEPVEVIMSTKTATPHPSLFAEAAVGDELSRRKKQRGARRGPQAKHPRGPEPHTP